jgi:alkanesulfonate monooxygenase
MAARFADEFNIPPFGSLEDSKAAYERVRAACESSGRDPATMRFSTSQVLCCGEDQAVLERRAAVIGMGLSDLRTIGAAGTPDEVVERLGAFGELGATRAYLQMLDLGDLDHIRLLAAEVAPHLR